MTVPTRINGSKPKPPPLRSKAQLARYEVWWNGGKIWTFEAPPDVDPMVIAQRTIPWRQEELELRRIA